MITLISNLLNVIYVSVSSCVKDNEINLYNNNSILIENYFNDNFKLIKMSIVGLEKKIII